MVKLRQKVSGCMRTLTGAKQGHNHFEVLIMLAEGHPGYPTPT